MREPSKKWTTEERHDLAVTLTHKIETEIDGRDIINIGYVLECVQCIRLLLVEQADILEEYRSVIVHGRLKPSSRIG